PGTENFPVDSSPTQTTPFTTSLATETKTGPFSGDYRIFSDLNVSKLTNSNLVIDLNDYINSNIFDYYKVNNALTLINNLKDALNKFPTDYHTRIDSFLDSLL